MNVYIASFMLLLFNAVGVNTPAAAMVTETSGNSAASEAETTAQTHRERTESSLAIYQFVPTIISEDLRQTRPIWPVILGAATSGDKLEHEEGAP
ncbi:MAG: hypothetical protein ABJO01_00765 [Parasphingorhabdus sp.]|uniref:hypothetical protein n=1 Tax=Parasphingorhabdus sp. TaxID=2709688 RepID=UPI003296BFE2